MADSSHRVTTAVALIGVVGTLGAVFVDGKVIMTPN